MKRSSGFSLLEATIGLFIMALVLVSAAHIFGSLSNSGQTMERAKLAGLVLMTAEEDTRAWVEDQFSRQAADFADDSAWSDLETHLNTLAGSEAQITVIHDDPTYLFSPSEALEAVHPLGVQRDLNQAAKVITLRVTFEDQSLETTTLIQDPMRDPALARIEITSTSGSTSVGRDGSLDLQASLIDERGQVVQGATFRWRHSSATGGGTLEYLDRNGIGCRFLNRIESSASGEIVYNPGSCRLRVSARYKGHNVVAFSDEITVQP